MTVKQFSACVAGVWYSEYTFRIAQNLSRFIFSSEQTCICKHRKSKHLYLLNIAEHISQVGVKHRRTPQSDWSMLRVLLHTCLVMWQVGTSDLTSDLGTSDLGNLPMKWPPRHLRLLRIINRHSMKDAADIYSMRPRRGDVINGGLVHCRLLAPKYGVMLRLRGGSISYMGPFVAQQVELAESLQEAAALLSTCSAEDMAFFSSREAINCALSAMRQVPATAIEGTLPALLKSAKGCISLWRRGSSIARTLRLLSDLHPHLLSSSTGGAAAFVNSTAVAASPMPRLALADFAQALTSRVLDDSIQLTFSTASVIDCLACLEALGFQSSATGTLVQQPHRPVISASVLDALQRLALQQPVSRARDGADLLRASAALQHQSAALIAHVAHALAPAQCGTTLDISSVSDLLRTAVQGKWLVMLRRRAAVSCGEGGGRGGEAGPASANVSVSERELLVQLCQGCPDILRQYCSRGGGLNRALTAP